MSVELLSTMHWRCSGRDLALAVAALRAAVGKVREGAS